MPKFRERFVTFATIVLEKIAKLLHAFKMKTRAKKSEKRGNTCKTYRFCISKTHDVIKQKTSY